MSEILILGASGKTGRRLVRRLRAAGEKVRPASRSSQVRFDWSDPGTWDETLRGAHAVYLVAPDSPGPVHEFVARAADVRKYVVLSGRGADKLDAAFSRSMLDAEQAARDSGAEWTVLRANNFNQNFDEFVWRDGVTSGLLTLPLGRTPEPFVDVEDIAEVAAAVLTGDGHSGRTYELSGPRGLTFEEAVEIIARASGRSIRYEEVTPEAYRAQLVTEGWGEEDADGVLAMFAYMRAGHVAEPVDGVRQVLGREAASFEDYARRVWS
ncbi:NAD(P)H-binding protein [Nonomuraea sp. NPDC059007]|uniref:NmrA family NAD(P)-binding protein n=1 Tax=Nonomuraea sp. NPDC059007 TaxID=3346692 RepID=UPI00368B38DB